MRINTEDAITATQYEYFTPCAQGLEAVVAGELKALGAERVRPLQAGVAFFGPLKTGYRACLWLRSASRVLLVLSRVEATDADCLYESVKALPWEQHLDPSRTIAIHARGTNEKLGDTRFIALKVKDALCDRLRELTGRRPSVQKDRPDVKLDVSLRSNRATVSLDLSGEPLHMRKYRVPDYRIVAPLRETLAAFMCIKAGWDAPFHENFSKVLLDPLCGSGTIALEAALIALDRAPGLLRDYWGFTGWLAHEEELWQETLREAQSRAAVALQSFVVSGSKPLIHASDSDEASVQIARESARLAGVEKIIDFEVADIATIAPSVDKTGTGERLVITNPPYGHRLSSESKLPALYSALQSLNDPSASPAP
ncbi:MAG: THUMP domain-containing protein, partial [Coriobacteriales bacterium]|nr:THUMP domain-containing protein [Coriobacteriales bacterium]